MDQIIKKAIVPVAGLGTRFLPLSKVLPKELWPVANKPAIQHILEEAKDSGIEDIIFVTSKEKEVILEYFKEYPKNLKRLLKQRDKKESLQEIENFEEFLKGLRISSVSQKEALGDGHAILQAISKIKKEAVAVLFGDDIVQSNTPCLEQLINIYKTCERPVVALSRVSKEKLSSYGVAKVEKIASRVFKIKKIIEKPAPGEEPSDLAIVGKYILTPEVFEFLQKAKPTKGGEIILANVFGQMLQEGKTIYGHEIEGKWLECGNKLAWKKTDIYLSLQDEKFGPETRRFIKYNKLI
jgi:UTP--glucose-1-phosphate uridylyltransferase